jgi:hypothetical protein
MSKHKFEQNILKLSETDDMHQLHTEWRYVRSDKKPKDEKGICVCCRAVENISYFYNHKTGHTIAAGTTCATKLKKLIKNKGISKDGGNLAHLEPGIYVEIADLDEYSAEIRAELCAILRVEIARCDEEALRTFLRDPESLLNDADLIAFARERLAVFVERRRVELERWNREVEERRLEREREEARLLEQKRITEMAEQRRIQIALLKEENADIEQMKKDWGTVDRIIKTADELPDEEEFRDADESERYWCDAKLELESLELLEERRQARLIAIKREQMWNKEKHKRISEKEAREERLNRYNQEKGIK